jgi:hypothetical protein
VSPEAQIHLPFRSRCHSVTATRSSQPGSATAMDWSAFRTNELVEIGQRQTGLAHARGRQLQAHIFLAGLERRAIGDDEDFRAGLGQRIGDGLCPDILADRHAQHHAAHDDWRRQGPGGENALFVEHAVIGQVMLEAQRGDLAAVQQRHGIVELAVLNPGGAHQDRGAAVGGILGQCFHGGAGVFLQGRLQHQVLGRIADDEEFGEQDYVGALRGGAGGAGAGQVARDVAHHGIELGKRDAKAVCHGRCFSGC